MKISVILCTYNRCQSLAKALDSVASSNFPEPLAWEVLVVDNNSHDQTRALVENYCRRYPGRFRYLLERQPGKSHALNTGIREARGEVLAFMDDDVIVEINWLQNLTTPLLHGEAVGSGGRILPQQDFSPPRWLPVNEHALAVLAMFDRGQVAGRLVEPPFGTNMAFQKKMFEKYGGFRTDLGPRPGSEMRSEDTEFGRRLLNAVELLRYEPSAVVYHEVPEHRLRKKYFLNWTFDKGRADFREFGIESGTTWFLRGVPLYLFRRLAVWTLRWMVSLKPSQRFSCRLKVLYLVGQTVESYRQSNKTEEYRERLPQPRIQPPR